MKNYIYAFDPSLSCTGVSIFKENGSFELISSIATKDKDTHGKRLKEIGISILEYRLLYPTKLIILERGFSRFHNATAALYKVHGLLNYLFWDCEQIYYPPKKIKQHILKGNATKKQIKEKILKTYKNIKFKNDDESDAFSVGLTYFIEKGIIKWDKKDD
jgi:Holliday junction resolvasome RuvABC endonuclease subunit